MDLFEVFQRLGLAVAIGAAVGVERHWREREEPRGGRIAGIRTFTLIGMTGGVAGLLETTLQPQPLPGLVLSAFLIVVSFALLRFAVMEAAAEHSFSATTIIAAISTFALGSLAMLGDMRIASAAATAIVVVLSSRQFLHAAIRRLTWPELRSAVVLLAIGFLVLPLIPQTPLGPFGGVSPRSLTILVIILASVSYLGYVAERLFGASRGQLVAGAIGGLVSSTATTLTLARRSAAGVPSAGLAAGALAAGAISLLRTCLLLMALAPSLGSLLLPPLLAGAAVLALGLVFLAREGSEEMTLTTAANPFDLLEVLRMALMITVIAFVARAASAGFGKQGVYLVSFLSALADVDAATVTIVGMRESLNQSVAVAAILLAVTANMAAKAAYALGIGAWRFGLGFGLVSLAAVAAGLAVSLANGLV